MSGKSIKCDDKKISKSEFSKDKKLLYNSDEIDVDKVLVYKKESYGINKSFKYFVGYNDDKIKPLCIKLSQMISYVKYFTDNKTMSFKVIDNKLLKNTLKYGKKNSNLVGKKIDSEPVYGDNDKYIKTKIRIYGDKVNTNFQGKKIPKENASCKCISIIMLDSAA